MARLIFNYPFIGREYRLEKETTMIGRAPENDLSIPDYGMFRKMTLLEQRTYLSTLKNVSRIHARITVRGGQYFIEDIGTSGQGSNYGTFINEIRLEAKKPYPLSDNDHLRFGPIETVFMAE